MASGISILYLCIGEELLEKDLQEVYVLHQQYLQPQEQQELRIILAIKNRNFLVCFAQQCTLGA